MKKGLQLTRRVGEALVVNGNIEITIDEIRTKNQVKLRIEAPGETTIFRKEIQDRIDKETK